MGWDGKSNNIDDTPFNMAMMFYIGLNKIIQAKREACLEDDYLRWYKILRLLYREINFKFKKEEKKAAVEAFNQCKKWLPLIEQSPIFPQKVYELLDEIDSNMTGIMDKRHMIFPNINTKEGMKDLEDRFGLDGKNKNK